jgi:hypothetical protein
VSPSTSPAPTGSGDHREDVTMPPDRLTKVAIDCQQVKLWLP